MKKRQQQNGRQTKKYGRQYWIRPAIPVIETQKKVKTYKLDLSVASERQGMFRIP